MPQAPAELTVIDAAYQLVVWGSERVAKFPYGQNTRTKAIRMPHVYFRVA
jgi:hypothetical protein